MSLRFFLCIACLFLLTEIAVRAQVQDYRFFHYSSDEGLIDNTANCFLKDRNGFLWIGTNSGLSRFDGFSFTNYTCNPSDSLSLSGNQVTRLFEDAQGRIWISTHDNGLSVYNPQTNRFKRFMFDPGKPSGVPSNNPTAICTDSQGRIWVGFFGKGLAQYNPMNDSFELTSFDTRIFSYNFNEIMDIALAENGDFWISTRIGLVQFNPLSGQYKRIEQLEPDGSKNPDKNLFIDIVLGPDGHVFIGTWIDGIYEYNVTAGTWKQHLIDRTKRENIGYANKINDFIFLEPSKILFTSYYYGFGILDLDTDSIEYLELSNERWTRTPGVETSYCIYKSDQQIFLGTNTGFTRMTKRSKAVFEYNGSSLKYNFENGTNVLSAIIAHRDDSLLYGGTFYRDGFYSFSNKTGKVKALVPLEGHSGPLGINGTVPSYFSDRIIHVASSKGVLRFDLNNPYKLTEVALPSGFPSHQMIWSMARDHHSSIWLAPSQGLFVWNERENTLVNHTESFTAASGLSNYFLISLFVDSDEWLWAVSDTRRLFRYNPHTRECRKFNSENPTRDLLKGAAESVLEDAQGKIWINMFSVGLACYIPENDSIRYITSTDGLLSARVLSIALDGENNLWVLSDKGVSVVNTSNLLVRNFTHRQGLEIADATLIDYHADGYMYIAGRDYIWKFKPSDLLTNDSKGRIFITSIEVMSNDYSKNTNYNSIDTLQLSYSENYVRFRFTVPDVSSEVDYYYYTFTEGLDNEWVLQGKDGAVSYSQLNNGTYTIHLRAKNGAGEWCTEERIITLIITPPFWKKTLFLVAVSLAIVAMLFWLYRWRIGVIRRKANEKSTLRQQMNELENKALRSQMNPHFIFNSLNSINSYIIKNKTDEASAFVSKFARLIRLILDNSMESTVLLEKELMALNLYIEIENKRFENKFSWEINVGENVNTAHLLVPPMVIQPYVENAIWHGLLHKDAPGKLLISIRKHEEYLEISIEDNGVGRSAALGLRSKTSLKTKSHGLDVTSKRISNFNGELYTGNAVSIEDLITELNQPSGTRVVLKLALIHNSNKSEL
jgi:ligand-binding sensor domain-containing protein/two-component sensor histidine kinase